MERKPKLNRKLLRKGAKKKEQNQNCFFTSSTNENYFSASELNRTFKKNPIYGNSII